MNAIPQLKLGIPKGSLEKATVELFAQAGWTISINSRNYFPAIDDPTLICKLMRPQEMAMYVADGTLDVALTGWDWIIERDCQDKVTDVATLEYSKSSNKPCRWVLVAPENSPIQGVQDLQGKRIATELQSFTRRYLEERGVQAEVIFSWGATEAKVVEGLVDAVVEITETGSTLRAHRLRIVEELLETRTKLIANPKAMEDPWKRNKVDQIALLLKAALDARHKVMLKMNVPASRLDTLMAILPSLTSPTVNPLLDHEWRAVETVVDRNLVRDLLPRLKEAGAIGILEFDLKKVV
ncbi:MAG: ATP phosphoribosyltransferase [Magnetococcales bacterium]|nr:ATP phosphoribosyltransferase [Magnetococcales bacterium]MBF0349006.1 ATP phosphoribosyltransferase [Magnetococcales bacterium]MBF0631969.1 ATP phosphoribosyltransferase [Magnetococcales bacterium]